jgi:hypothetical protein
MVNIWKANTIVFAAQLAVGWVVYVLGGNVPAAIFTTGFSALFVFIGAATDDAFFGTEIAAALRTTAFTGVFAGFAVFFTLSAVAGSHTSFAGHALICIVALALIVYTLTLTVATAKKMLEQADEDDVGFPSLFVTVLPLGVGTVLGGAILLYGRLDPKRDTFV